MSDEPILGLEGEVCRSCHAPLATDQRYCMNCGERRGATRVDLDALAAENRVEPEAPAVPAADATANSQGPWTPMAIVGGIATLAVVLLVGVMLGRGDNNDPVQVAAAPVAATAAPTTTTAADTGTDKVASTGTGGGDTKNTDKKGSGGKEKVVDATKAPGAETVTDDQLNALDQASGDDYAKESKNLPDTIALPGKPPPVDNGEPGAGTQPQVIK